MHIDELDASYPSWENSILPYIYFGLENRLGRKVLWSDLN